MLNELLAQAIVSQRQVQGEHKATQARLLREAVRGRRPQRAGPGARLRAVRRAAAAGAGMAGGWLVRAGTWMQSKGAVPVAAGPPC